MPTCCHRTSAAQAPAIAPSRDARARTAGRTWSARLWRQLPRLPATSSMYANSTSRLSNERVFKPKVLILSGASTHATVLNTHWHDHAAGPRQRRHRSNGAEAISEGADARRIWADTFLRLALFARRKTESGLCVQFSSLQRRVGLAGARELRLRLQPRARPVGREGLRIPRGHRHEL